MWVGMRVRERVCGRVMGLGVCESVGVGVRVGEGEDPQCRVCGAVAGGAREGVARGPHFFHTCEAKA